ncbi:hypothetical protein T05_8051, partial [Trichinella murrelli]
LTPNESNETHQSGGTLVQNEPEQTKIGQEWTTRASKESIPERRSTTRPL